MEFEPAPSFVAAVSGSDDDMDLARAALEVARDEYPNLQIESILADLDTLADRVRELSPDNNNPIELLRSMNTCLYSEFGLSGNTKAYSDPRNSYLNDVLERKLGIPITLSVVYLEIGWRLDLPLVGVSFPGHFLVKCHMGQSLVVVDPFDAGRSLDEDDLVSRLEAVVGERDGLRDLLPRFLVGASKREILSRVLRNLKLIFMQAERYKRALVACNKLCLLDPDSAVEFGDRGKVYEQLDCFSAALGDYRRALALDPAGPQALAIKQQAVKMEQQVARLN